MKASFWLLNSNDGTDAVFPEICARRSPTAPTRDLCAPIASVC